jgi:hypothetical protein
MEEALIGLVGVIVGLVLSEYFRRRARLESYSSVLFAKRLGAYEILDKKINALHDLAASLAKDAARPLVERQSSWDAAKEEFTNFCLENRLCLSPEGGSPSCSYPIKL